MEKIFSLLKKVFIGYDRKKEQIGLLIEFYEQKETATVAPVTVCKDKTVKK